MESCFASLYKHFFQTKKKTVERDLFCITVELHSFSMSRYLLFPLFVLCLAQNYAHSTKCFSSVLMYKGKKFPRLDQMNAGR
jgi:hypothetical protein